MLPAFVEDNGDVVVADEQLLAILLCVRDIRRHQGGYLVDDRANRVRIGVGVVAVERLSKPSRAIP